MTGCQNSGFAGDRGENWGEECFCPWKVSNSGFKVWLRVGIWGVLSVNAGCRPKLGKARRGVASVWRFAERLLKA